MILKCGECQQQVSLEESKVPNGVFKIKCPKCGKLITGQKDSPSVPPAEATPLPSSAISPEIEAFVKREIANSQKQITGALQGLFGGDFKPHDSGPENRESGLERRALVCDDEPMFVDLISDTARRLGYSVEIARNTADAIKKIESNVYQLLTVDLVFPDDKEGGVKIIAKINGQKSYVRRQTFVVLISSSIKSADANAAFFHGANITVNKDEIKNLEALIREGQRHFQKLYHIFNRIVTDKNERIL